MKGKYAAKATLRRSEQAEAQIQELRADLAGERARHHGDVEELKLEVRRLRASILAEARQMADKAIEHRRAELEQALKNQGVSWDVIDQLRIQKDKLIYNACRYISMTTGNDPWAALAMVWTWFTEMDCYALPDRDVVLVTLGLPRNGWVVKMLGQLNPRLVRRNERIRREANIPAAWNLDYAQEHAGEFPRIHPGYGRWKTYYENVTYRNGIELAEDDGTVTVIR